jgi:hypothetical protein
MPDGFALRYHISFINLVATVLTCNLLLHTFDSNACDGRHRRQLLRAVWRTEYVNCHTLKIERQHKLSELQNCYAPFVQSP